MILKKKCHDTYLGFHITQNKRKINSQLNQFAL
jgi:hypothetical protein